MLALANNLLTSFEKNCEQEAGGAADQALPGDVLLPANPNALVLSATAATGTNDDFAPFFSGAYRAKYKNVLHRYNRQLIVCIFQVRVDMDRVTLLGHGLRPAAQEAPPLPRGGGGLSRGSAIHPAEGWKRW